MRGEAVSKIRGRAAMIGFSGARADTKVKSLSGGEKAHLMMGLAAFDGPQFLILDEPTNHLDIDSRGELIEAINDYEGACILVSHDRRLLEACVDRLWLAANGTVKPFDGDLADYSRFVLGADEPAGAKGQARRRRPRRGGPRREPQLKRELAALEDRINRFHDLLRRLDEALAAAKARVGGDAAKIAELAGKRAELERALMASAGSMVRCRPRRKRYEGRGRVIGVAVGLLMTATWGGLAASPAPWPDSFVGRLEALALVETLNADLFSVTTARR